MISLNENLWNNIGEDFNVEINEDNCYCETNNCVCNICECHCFDVSCLFS